MRRHRSGQPKCDSHIRQITVNTGETINFDARTSTTPNPTIIDEFRWNFGDGEKKTTKQGVISHAFTKAGNFEVTVEVFNDNGDSDSASILVFVNAIPEIILNIPDFVKTGQEARLDASAPSIPRGGVEIVGLRCEHRFRWRQRPLNDIDGSGPVTRITVTEAGNITGP